VTVGPTPQGGLRVVLATANPHKVDELAAIVGDALELLPRPADVPEVVEDAGTIEGNARLKAVALCDATGLPAMADDTGLFVDALDGLPGVDTAHYAGPRAAAADNVAKLLAALADVPDGARTARFRTVVLLRFPDGAELIGEGVVEGRIVLAPRGEGGFGYDPVFVPVEGDGRTFAELPAAAKHEISHRGRAVRDLLARLGDQASGGVQRRWTNGS
jgi:XTP/dITP diphosphohydrolase